MNSDDKHAKKLETEALAKEMFDDIIAGKPIAKKLAPFDEALQRARRLKQVVHVAGCKIVTDSGGVPSPTVARKLIFDMFEEGFRTWNREELTFLAVSIYAKMEMADLNIPDI